jgi:hypothetical protein
MKISTRAVVLMATLGLLLGGAGTTQISSARQESFDVNDLSYLWPVPKTAEDVKGLISGDAAGADGRRMWPEAVFKTLIATAPQIAVQGSSGKTFQISFKPFEQAFADPATWKVASFRVDGSAPGGHSPFVSVFGSTPQLRIVLQPVTIDGTGAVKVHDVTAHLAFSYTKPGPPPTPGVFPAAVPDKDAFRAMLEDLRQLKAASAAGGAATAGPLRVHPGLQARVPGFADKIKAFLVQRAAQGDLRDLAFMGIEPNEPWIFFAMHKRADGVFERVRPQSLGGSDAQMLTFKGGTHVMPVPATTNVSPKDKQGVATAPLFPLTPESAFGTPAVGSAARPTLQDIPDIIANPRMAHVLNTDCVSCHTETTRRRLLKLPAGDGQFKYALPAGISGVDEGHLPSTRWNVRNFGWGPAPGGVMPTISMRTANEAAEAAEFVNREYFGAASPAPAKPNGDSAIRRDASMPQNVARPLTLVMNIKSPQDFVALKALIEKLQSLPPDQNPIVVALNKLSTVHFARFVFLSDKQLAVITTYDGDFEEYIDSFVDNIGDVFDKLLAHMSDAPPLPVSKPENRPKFLEYVRKNDLTAIPPFYSAYPQLKVLDILTLQKQHGGS